jgi:DNA polymerase-4
MKTLGDIASAPEELLTSRLGVHGGHLRNFACGIDDRTVEAHGEAKSMSRETTFAIDTLDREFLMATLYHLNERVGADLRSHEKLARCVTLKLRYADFTTITRSQTFKQGIDADQAIFDAGKKMLIAALTARKQPVRLIGIAVSGFVPVARQLEMLDGKAERLNELNRAVDRIRARYGFKAIQMGRTAEFGENTF